ncbi:ATP synthase mitochondrial F1 complex assembly factor 1 [Podila epicladia]|nr:ATP synthase mitochondrial F1 complex assembly factor 1 [Podila epicladia]KAG0094573.1 ATP synthase mitochondrial F1 complex assembly factor 1 [Podila epicladia]
MASTFRILSRTVLVTSRITSYQRSGHARIITRSKHVDYTQKYAEKLKEKAQKEGVATIAELKAKVLPPSQTAFKRAQPLDKRQIHEQTQGQVQALAQAQMTTSQSDSPASNSSSGSSDARSSHSLDKILKLDLVANLDAENISKIWIQKHMDQEDTISAVVPAETYKKMLARSKEYPLFLLPLSHGDGVEFYLLQFAFHQVIFTSLLEYKTHGENARPYLTLTHYPELIETKGIVLMNGTVSTNPKVLTLDQAQILTFGLQQYYVSDHLQKQALLHDFHKNPANFSHEKLIELTEISG